MTKDEWLGFAMLLLTGVAALGAASGDGIGGWLLLALAAVVLVRGFLAKDGAKAANA